MSDQILFIDANVYLRFYDSANNKFTELLKTIVELRNYIFVTEQIRDEVHRNKLSAAIYSFDSNYKSLGISKTTLPEHLDENEDKKLTAWNKKRNKIINDENELKKEYCNIVSNTLESIMNSTDAVSIELEKIFALAKPPSFDDIDAARLRKEIGNPPGKAKDPLGDQLSWEQFLRHYKGSEIWIITNDGDYLSQYNGKYYLNPFLFNELKRIGNNKPPKIKLFESLTKGIEDFVGKLDYSVKSMPSGNELGLIMIEEAEIHLHPEMARKLVASSNIAAVGYDPETQTLEVEFLNGGVYQYFNVPREVYDNLLSSGSMGAYFQNNIKSHAFTFSKIK